MTSKALKTAKVEQLPVSPTPMDLMQSMIEKGVDADQLDKMLTLQERWQASEARVAFSNAMADFQAHCPTIKKTKRADRYDYAPLDTVQKTIRPHLDNCGLSVRFSTRKSEKTNERLVVCIVSHRDGHEVPSDFPMFIDEHMKVNDTQKGGSANSYAKRYALMNALNLVASDEDDDGYSAGSQFIDDHQAVEIQDHIDALGIDQGGFFKYLGINGLDELKASDLPKAMNAIERKRKVAKK